MPPLGKGQHRGAHNVGFHAPSGSISAVANGAHCQIPKVIAQVIKNNVHSLRNIIFNNTIIRSGINGTSGINAALLAKGNTGAAHNVGSHAPSGSISAVANGVHRQIPKAIGTSANNATSKNNVPGLRNIIFNNTIIRSANNATSANNAIKWN